MPAARSSNRSEWFPAGICPPPEENRLIPPTEKDRNFRHRVIQGEVNDENAYVLGGVAGHAGCFARAEDLALFAECLLGVGLQDQPQITACSSPTLWNCLHAAQTFPPGTSHALGWDTPSAPSSSGKYFSPRSYGHLGYTGTSLWIDPERGTLCYSSNQPHLAGPRFASHQAASGLRSTTLVVEAPEAL